MIDNTCDLCIEFNRLGESLFDELKLEIDEEYFAAFPNRILYSRGDILVAVSLGEIEFGHIMICTKYHATSFNRIYSQDKVHFEHILSVIDNIYSTHFGTTPIFFEHGDPTGSNPSGANCIHHAHLHALPQQIDLSNQLPPRCKHLASAPMSDLPPDLDEPYVLVAGADRTAHIFADLDLPRQFLRRLYCEQAGLESRWHWVTILDIRETHRSFNKLKALFDVA